MNSFYSKKIASTLGIMEERQHFAYPAIEEEPLELKRRRSQQHCCILWKRTNVEYGTEWLCWYKLASRCLSSHLTLSSKQ